MSTSFKKLALFSFAPAVGILLAMAALNVYIDPLRVFHDSPVLDGKYYSNTLYAGAGYIREYVLSQRRYKSLVLGSSLSQNFLPEDVQNTLNWDKPLMLTWGASRPYEQYTAIQYALKSGIIKNVLWEVNFSYSTSIVGETYKKREFLDYLYTEDILPKIPYVFSIDTFEDAMAAYTGGLLFSPRYNKWTSDFEKMNYWMDRAVRGKRYRSFASSKNRQKLQKTIDVADKRNAARKRACPPPKFPCVDEYLLKTIRENPDVHFELFYPPVFAPRYRISARCAVQNYIQMRKYLAQAISKLPNAHISSFEDIPGLTEELTNYKDLQHYTAEINHKMLEWIKSGEQRETPKTVSKTVQELLKKSQRAKVLN